MRFKISCPACEQKIDCDKAKMATFECPSCGQQFSGMPVPDLQVTVVPTPPTVSADVEPVHLPPIQLRTQHGSLVARKPAARSGNWLILLVCLLALAGIGLKKYWNVYSEQQKRILQEAWQRQEQIRIKQEAAKKQQENIQKQTKKQEAALVAEERITKETDQWNSLMSNATPKKPFINSLGIPFARVSGTNFLVSIKPVSQSALSKSHDPSLNGLSAPGNTWREAVDFCTWLSYAENQNYHLPSNAEWEAVMKSGILEGNKESWVWSSDAGGPGGPYGTIGDVKVLRGNSFKYINRSEPQEDVVIHSILAPKM